MCAFYFWSSLFLMWHPPVPICISILCRTTPVAIFLRLIDKANHIFHVHIKLFKLFFEELLLHVRFDWHFWKWVVCLVNGKICEISFVNLLKFGYIFRTSTTRLLLIELPRKRESIVFFISLIIVWVSVMRLLQSVEVGCRLVQF